MYICRQCVGRKIMGLQLNQNGQQNDKYDSEQKLVSNKRFLAAVRSYSVNTQNHILAVDQIAKDYGCLCVSSPTLKLHKHVH